MLALDPGERIEIFPVGALGIRARQITRMQVVTAQRICSYVPKLLGARSSDLGALARFDFLAGTRI